MSTYVNSKLVALKAYFLHHCRLLNGTQSSSMAKEDMHWSQGEIIHTNFVTGSFISPDNKHHWKCVSTVIHHCSGYNGHFGQTDFGLNYEPQRLTLGTQLLCMYSKYYMLIKSGNALLIYNC